MNKDISNWGWGQILELPDHLFGRRHVVGVSGFLVAAGAGYDISESALPERCVIWEINSRYSGTIDGFGDFSLALGDQLPTTDAEFGALEQLIPDMGYRTALRRDYTVATGAVSALRRLKIGVDTGGRRLVLRFGTMFQNICKGEVELVVSSIPRSLPEWFV